MEGCGLDGWPDKRTDRDGDGGLERAGELDE